MFNLGQIIKIYAKWLSHMCGKFSTENDNLLSAARSKFTQSNITANKEYSRVIWYIAQNEKLKSKLKWNCNFFADFIDNEWIKQIAGKPNFSE